MGLDFLEGLNAVGDASSDRLKEVGDKCLLFSGLFPDRAVKLRVNSAYYEDLGRSAYSTVAMRQEEDLSLLYNSLSDSFLSLRDVLRAMRSC